ncbi:MAG: hypothetical protein H7123_06915 [Thermoleophilia bacterium]|nr:hypothetical protein [Thermoleophilia bacterium]
MPMSVTISPVTPPAPAADVRTYLRGVADEMVTAQQAVRASGKSLSARVISLAVSNDQQVAFAMTTLQASPLKWIDDGLCAQRAMFGAHLINKAAGSGLSGIADTAAAGMAVQSATLLHQLKGGWSYHVAPVMRTADGLVVLDPLTAPRPLALDAWRELIGARSKAAIWSPLQSVGYNMPPGLRIRIGSGSHLRAAANELAGT